MRGRRIAAKLIGLVLTRLLWLVVVLLSLLGGLKPSPLGDGFSKRAVACGTLGS